jgi:hypothetical protein
VFIDECATSQYMYIRACGCVQVRANAKLAEAHALYTKGHELAQKERWSEAAEVVRRALALQPEHPAEVVELLKVVEANGTMAVSMVNSIESYHDIKFLCKVGRPCPSYTAMYRQWYGNLLSSV